MKLLLSLIFLFTSCASYVNSVHKKIDNENRSKRRMMKAQRFNNSRPIVNPVTLNGGPSANNQRNMHPSTQRQYQTKGTRRYKAKDLVDNNQDGSLWSGENSDNFLFVTNSLKRKGDIVIIEVLDELKDKIQAELKRSFPTSRRRKKGKKKSTKTEDKKEPATENVATKTPGQPSKIHDKISTKVVELVNQDYLLLRGRKEVIYKKRKRYFELQVIVSRKDISSRDTVSSDDLLEPRINVLRY